MASRAELTLDFSAERTVRLEVRDDGSGIAEPTPRRPDTERITPAGDGARGGFGLIGIEERAASLGGSMTFASAPGQGSRLRVEVPG
jgi:signal transduction histidine kinase